MILDLVRSARRAIGRSDPPGSMFQGYVDERSIRHVRGWVRDLSDPAARVGYEVVLDGTDGPRILACGIARDFSPVLAELGVGEARYAFQAEFDPPLSEPERDRVQVRVSGCGKLLELAPGLVTAPSASTRPAPVNAIAPRIEGWIDARSVAHVAGWLRNMDDTAERLAFVVVLAGVGRVLAEGVADAFNPGLAQLGIGDAHYGFTVAFTPPLTEAERDRVEIRCKATGQVLPLARGLQTAFEPIGHLAMDLVNNCNLRCPFCVYDYTHTHRTEFMTDATFDAALRLVPYVSPGNFWLSCLHEATLHPALLDFIARIPREWRHKVMFTTNLAKRMQDGYFAALAESGLHHINISIESLEPELYERFRKGARYHIFQENWDRLLAAIDAAPAPPMLRYNAMAYRSNLAELPRLTETLLDQKRGSQVEIRYTFDGPQIPDAFKAAEYLDAAGWDQLEEALARFPPERVLLARPPTSGVPLAGDAVTRPLSLRMDWSGRLTIYDFRAGPDGRPAHRDYLVTNIRHIRDPLRLLMSL